MEAGKIIQIAFYNKKQFGVRYLETALKNRGYEVHTVFLKNFNSVKPSRITETELELLRLEISSVDPIYIGLSVMSSMYLETVVKVLEMITSEFNIPVVCGGAYATMFPERLISAGADIIIRGDGENISCELADALFCGKEYKNIPSLCYSECGKIVKNEIGMIASNLDDYGIPSVKCDHAIYIENNTLYRGDPQLDTLSYEVIASRGCPFTCSYCCCPNLREIMPPEGKNIRFRSVESVIAELIEAKKHCKRIAFVHFYDEIFPKNKEWIDKFAAEYKKHVRLPFTIWTHPKVIDEYTLRTLVKAGLVEVIMGIQSGSPHIRRDIFKRFETNEEIIHATRLIRASGVFWASYDFMLRHPFENVEDLKESYYLTKKLSPPFELQLHGLNFLPGTDIVNMAIDQGFFMPEEMEKIMYAPMEEQFKAYWQRDGNREIELWYKMIDVLQFPALRRKVEKFEHDPLSHDGKIIKLWEKAVRRKNFRYIYKKTRIVLKRFFRI